MKKLILASASPRRRDILNDLGVPFEVDPARDFQEIQVDDHDPEHLLKANALGKAQEVASRHTNAFVIGVDTIGVYEGVILEKPKDREDAIRMISLLSGKTHEVWSSIALIDSESYEERIEIERTKITFSEMTSHDIERYVDLGESMDKAAAYAVQGKAALFVERIEGDYLNVVGLPLVRLHQMLKEFDFHLMDVVE